MIDETYDENVDIFAGQQVDRGETDKARQDELLPKGWYTPSSVTVLPRMEGSDGKNPGRGDVDVNLTVEKEDGTLAFLTIYSSPNKNNLGVADYRFNVWAKIVKVYEEAMSVEPGVKYAVKDVITFLEGGQYQVYAIRTKDDSNMVNKIRAIKG